MSCFLCLSDDIYGIGTKAAHFEVMSNRKQKIIFVGEKQNTWPFLRNSKGRVV